MLTSIKFQLKYMQEKYLANVSELSLFRNLLIYNKDLGCLTVWEVSRKKTRNK